MATTDFAGAGLHAAGTPLRYLALGDSYTIGEGVDEAGRWPVQLARALRADAIPLDDPRIIARTGWTTSELDAAIGSELEAAAAGEAAPLAGFDLVSLLIGVNDQYREHSVEQYSTGFAGLLDRAIGFAGGARERVLVLSIPDWGVTPFARAAGRDASLVGARIDAFNARARGICLQRGVAFVDITAASREHGADPAMLAEDGLHPSQAAYAAWTRLALPWARAAVACR
ncbi:MAG: SGNH/GDSL hydrolase family protein [Lysobacteraceae bacterium]|nr:MAG: SGNH/GDSL hydrolase family protein [Xanthomonadaceae bacterium]